VNVVGPITRKGYRFKGEATVVDHGELFEQIMAFYESGEAPVTDARSRVRSAVLVTVESALPLVPPAYDLGRSEEAIRARQPAQSYSTGARVMDASPRMRLPNTAHISRPWRIHELARDFRLEDVWASRMSGHCRGRAARTTSLGWSRGSPRATRQSSSRAVRTLFAIQWKLGELLGWDGPDAGLGSRVPALGDRLPADLRHAPSGPDFDARPFTSLYLLDDECAAEIANRTMHRVMHIGWVADGTGGYRGQMAVLVKPNGLFGTACMAAIRPFRHLIVYPPMPREIEREWRARAGERTPAHAELRWLIPKPRSGKRRDFLDRIARIAEGPP